MYVKIPWKDKALNERASSLPTYKSHLWWVLILQTSLQCEEILTWDEVRHLCIEKTPWGYLYNEQTVAIIRQTVLSSYAGICVIGWRKNREISKNITKEWFLITWLIFCWDLKFGESTGVPQLDSYLICFEECGTTIHPLRRDSDEQEQEDREQD